MAPSNRIVVTSGLQLNDVHTPQPSSRPVFELGEAATVNRLSPAYLATHRPQALLALVPRAAVLFGAGAVSGALAKSITAPLDRVKVRRAAAPLLWIIACQCCLQPGALLACMGLVCLCAASQRRPHELHQRP